MKSFSTKKTIFDMYAFSALILLTSLMLVWTNLYNRPHQALWVNVYIETELVDQQSLNADQTLVYAKDDFPVMLGDITLEIVDRRVRIAEETSPLHYCAIQGWIDQPGLPLICAPNHFMAVIED